MGASLLRLDAAARMARSDPSSRKDRVVSSVVSFEQRVVSISASREATSWDYDEFLQFLRFEVMLLSN